MLSEGRLFVKLSAKSIPLSDIWIDREAFETLSPEEMKECIREDMLSFIEEINLLDHCKFFWR